MTQLPKMPRSSSRKQKPLVPCACGGCGMLTKSTWFSGHDGHCTGWAIRIEKGLLDIDAVPDEVKAGVARILAKRGTKVEVPETKAQRRARVRAERKAAKVAAENAQEVESVEQEIAQVA